MIAAARQQADFFGKLGEIGRLLQLQTALVWVIRAAIAGLVADTAMLLVARYTVFTPQGWLLAGVPAALATIGVLVSFLRRYEPRSVALRTDQRLDLKERLTTALELQQAPPAGSLAELQLHDALWHLGRVDAWRAFAPRVPGREAGALAAFLLVVATLLALPNPGKQAIQQAAASSNAVKQEAQKLDKTTADIKQNEAQTGNHSPDQQALDKTLSDLQRQLAQSPANLQQALASLQAAQQKLQSGQDQNPDAMAEALQAVAATFDNQPALQKVAQDIRGGNYAAAANDLNAAGQQGATLDPSQKAQLAAALRAAAGQARASNSQLADSLDRAAASLDGSSADATSAFHQTATELQNAGQHAQTQQNVGKALDQVQQSASNLAQQAGSSADASTSSGLAPGSGSPDAAGQSRSPTADGSAQNGPAAAGQNGSSAAMQSGAPGQAQNQGSGQGGQQGQGQGQDGQASGGSGGQGTETVYTGEPGSPQSVPGQQGANGAVSTGNDNSVADPAQNGSNVPYQQVIGQYQQQATQAMDRGQVPLSYREVVKDYFSSLGGTRQPANNQAS